MPTSFNKYYHLCAELEKNKFKGNHYLFQNELTEAARNSKYDALKQFVNTDEAPEPLKVRFNALTPPSDLADPVRKKARTASDSAHASGTLHQLSETPDDVMPNTVSRLGSNWYQATLRSGMVWRGDAELLKSLPQGEARLATLQTRERVAHAKAKAKMTANTEEQSPRHQGEPADSNVSKSVEGDHGEAEVAGHGGGAELHDAPPKRQRTLRQMFVSTGRERDDGGERVESSVEDSATTSIEFFFGDREEHNILLDWLRGRSDNIRCALLLRQITEWARIGTLREMRALAKAQNIVLKKGAKISSLSLLEAVKRHFISTITQEKGRHSILDQ